MAAYSSSQALLRLSCAGSSITPELVQRQSSAIISTRSNVKVTLYLGRVMCFLQRQDTNTTWG